MNQYVRLEETFRKLKAACQKETCLQSYPGIIKMIITPIKEQCGIEITQEEVDNYLIEQDVLRKENGILLPTYSGHEDAGLFYHKKRGYILCPWESQIFFLEHIRKLIASRSDEYTLALLDDNLLSQSIDVLCQARKLQTEERNGYFSFRLPDKMGKVYQVFQFVGIDENGYETLRGCPEDLMPTEMTLPQIRAKWYQMARMRRFGEYVFEGYLMNGTYLKLFLRLEDLKNKLKY